MKKKCFLSACIMGLFLIGFSASNFDEEENGGGSTPPTEVSDLEKNYFTIENAVYGEGEIPGDVNGETLEGISFNSQALTGGMNFITVISDKAYKRFYVGVKGIDGYWIIIPTEEIPSEPGTGAYHTYKMTVLYSVEFSTDLRMIVSAEDENGNKTKPYEFVITHVSSESGDLNINLTFSNAKDVDLHLITPSGNRIYYGNRGGTMETVDGELITYGLDHDSNAGCSIDNLNNENIYLPAEVVEEGTYSVIVDMYANCDVSTATSWSIVARYKGNIIIPDTGANPAAGVYPVGAGNGDMTTVMTFDVKKSAKCARAASRIKPGTFKPIPRSDMDDMKAEMESFHFDN